MSTTDRAPLDAARGPGLEATRPGRILEKQTEGEWAGLPGLDISLGVIPSSVHGVLDYVVGAGLITAPWVFRFSNIAPARLVMLFQGVVVIIYSLFTNYEWGVARTLPFRTHRLLDLSGAMLMLAAPWVLGFRRLASVFTMVGLFELTVTLLTRRHAYEDS